MCSVLDCCELVWGMYCTAKNHHGKFKYGILSVNYLVLAKGKTKEVYCCDIVVLIVQF